MYEKYFGLDENPFTIAPDPRYLFMSGKHQEALAHLFYSLNGSNRFVLLTGEVGTGKTTLCRGLLEQLPEDVELALIFHPRLSGVELIAAVCDELGVEYDHSQLRTKPLIDALTARLFELSEQGRRTFLIIDEAQNLAVDVLEEVRLLTNIETSTQKLLQIILVGQPELREILARPELRQLSQRITARYHLGTLNEAETQAYIAHRLAVAGSQRPLFSTTAVARVFRLTRGVPRLVNLVCDRALMGAYAKELASVDVKTVKQAANEVLDSSSTTRATASRPMWMLLAGVVFALVFVLGLSVFGDGGWFRWKLSDQSVSDISALSATGTQETAPSLQLPADEERMPEPALGSTSTELPPAPIRQLRESGLLPKSASVSSPQTLATRLAEDERASDSDAMEKGPQGELADVSTRTEEQFKTSGESELASVSAAEGAEAVVEPVSNRTDGLPTQQSADKASDAIASDGDASTPMADSKAKLSVTDAVAGRPLTGLGFDEDLSLKTTEAEDSGDDGDSGLVMAADDLGYRWGLHSLFARWGHDFGKTRGISVCQRALSVGLRCLEVEGEPAWLRSIALPRLLLLNASDSAASVDRWPERIKGRYVLVEDATGTGFVLSSSGGESVRMGQDSSWPQAASALVLWRAPSSWAGRSALRPGQTGAGVRWLRSLLSRLYPGKIESGSVYDDRCLVLVRRFQREHDLRVDGVVGAGTAMVMLASDPLAKAEQGAGPGLDPSRSQTGS